METAPRKPAQNAPEERQEHPVMNGLKVMIALLVAGGFARQFSVELGVVITMAGVLFFGFQCYRVFLR